MLSVTLPASSRHDCWQRSRPWRSADSSAASPAIESNGRRSWPSRFRASHAGPLFLPGRPAVESDAWTQRFFIEQTRFTPGSFNCETLFDYAGRTAAAARLEERMGEADFWNDSDKAQATVAELKQINAVLKPLDETIAAAADLEALGELVREDESLEEEFLAEVERVEKLVDQLELTSLLSGPHDACDALISIHARDGGTDANDWAEMLLRMYTAWANKRDLDVELLDRQDDDVAGIQNATIAIRGPWAYGYLRGEMGIHRLVRISPFNAEGKRQTSFAAVDVSPEISDDDTDIEIRDEDIREDVFRASGAGGQHVNKTSSAIRLTHFPSGIVVQCQSERSQHKNRATAIKMLRSRLARLEEEKREAEQLAKYKLQPKTGFGSQIRNYFLHPDQRVKDQRTGHYVGNFQSVLDGNLDGFLDAYLRWKASDAAPAAVDE
ncbi:MAG: peptide chain release factor 2 [Planctomycetia bacterium]|nr:peptide chain release factor 2 [Planctomycetia bacterium]